MPRSSLLGRLIALAALVALALALVGCAPSGPRFVDDGTAYTEATAMSLLSGVDVSTLAETASTEAPALRHEALTALRSRGGTAVAVADLVTRTFPPETRGVPVYFERATYKGKSAVLVIEAAGPQDGTLQAKRLWVLDDKGEVLFVGSK